MSVLSAQSIRRLCLPDARDEYRYRAPRVSRMDISHVYVEEYRRHVPLLTPFSDRSVIRGRSYGLSACTYDCRILLPPEAPTLTLPPGGAALAVTQERFNIPEWLCGSVLDKSTWARVFVTAFNTHLDPGWEGFLTVELANLGRETATYEDGDPLCQVKFELLDEPTELPYRDRKYSAQPPEPVPARFEVADGEPTA